MTSVAITDDMKKLCKIYVRKMLDYLVLPGGIDFSGTFCRYDFSINEIDLNAV